MAEAWQQQNKFFLKERKREGKVLPRCSFSVSTPEYLLAVFLRRAEAARRRWIIRPKTSLRTSCCFGNTALFHGDSFSFSFLFPFPHKSSPSLSKELWLSELTFCGLFWVFFKRGRRRWRFILIKFCFHRLTQFAGAPISGCAYCAAPHLSNPQPHVRVCVRACVSVCVCLRARVRVSPCVLVCSLQTKCEQSI